MGTNIDQLLAEAAQGGGPAVAQQGPLIPVRNPSVKSPYTSSGGSANAAERSIGGPRPNAVDMMDPATASNAIFGWSEADQRAFARRAWYLGGIKSPDDLQGAWDLWQQAVKIATGFSAAGNPMDPQDVLDLMLTGDPGAQRARKLRADGGIVTQKSRSINVASAQEAKSLIVEAFKTAVGREPTDAELRTYTSSLQSAMKANPTVTTSSQQYDSSGNAVGTATSTTTGGLDSNQFVKDQLAVDPQAAEYQAASSVFGAIMNALGPASGMMSGG